MHSFFTALGGNMNLLDPQGLAANRNGEITASQNKRLNSTVGWGQGCSTGLILMVLLVMTFSFGTVLFVYEPSDGFWVLLPFIFMAGISLVFLAMLGTRIWKLADTFIKLKRDRDNRAIRQAQGQVSFDKNGYMFQALERRLVLPSTANTGGLLPGATYRIFYLDESGFILSAEEAYPASPAQVRTALRDILAQANKFTPEELEQNRNGETTSSQRMKPLGQVLGGGVFGVMALIFGSLFFLPTFSSRSGDDFLPAMLVPAIFVGVFLLVSGWMVINGLLDMSVSSIEQVEGSGHKEKRTSGGRNRSTRYYYVVNGQSFQVNKTAYTALIDNLDYRVYYLPRTKKLVSIEPVDVTPDSSQYNFNR